ncbi:hypothetical protein CXZ05_19640 [Arthrobacter sp. AFG20]|nr:hypothetical protein CXZ05_19640 [Arthrobacter sp. AFG20]
MVRGYTEVFGDQFLNLAGEVAGLLQGLFDVPSSHRLFGSLTILKASFRNGQLVVPFILDVLRIFP